MSFQIDADFHKDRKQEKDSISINPPTARNALVSDAHYVAGTKIDNPSNHRIILPFTILP